MMLGESRRGNGTTGLGRPQGERGDGNAEGFRGDEGSGADIGLIGAV